MNLVLAENWWSLVIRGLLGILMGAIMLALPGLAIILWEGLRRRPRVIDGTT